MHTLSQTAQTAARPKFAKECASLPTQKQKQQTKNSQCYLKTGGITSHLS